MSHLVITDVGERGDPIHESSVVKVLTEQGQQHRRAVAVSERRMKLRNTTHEIRKWDAVVAELLQRRRRPVSAGKQSSKALAGATGVQATARGERTNGINWGPSAAGQLVWQLEGISHKPESGWQRRRCGHSKLGSEGTTQPLGEPRATGLAVQVRRLRCRLVARPLTDKTSQNEIRTVTAYKPVWKHWRRRPLRQAGLKPYWGKPVVRNFRGGGRNEMHGLMTLCHAARKSRYIGSH